MSVKTGAGAGQTKAGVGESKPGDVAKAELPDFFDIHCHAHTLSHPSFLALIQTLRRRRLEALFSQLTSFEYLASSLFHRGGEKIRNMLSVMENEPGDIFKLMEDDLTGVYAKSADETPLVRDGILDVGGQKYGRLVISPLLMDFGEPGPYQPDTYYDKYPKKTIDAQIVDVMLGIRDYRLTRPEGLLEIQPFLGINPKTHSPESLTRFLDTWLSFYTRDREEARADFGSMGEILTGDPDRKHSPFAGIKLYPPLGFDPWPADGVEREKVEILYSFAEERKIPLTVHCDDGGFRVIPLEEAWRNTSPARYRSALEKYPRLIVNFAHLGAQYSIPNRLAPPPTEWRDAIFGLMMDFPGVYGDFSFNGVAPEYYDSLLVTLGSMDPAKRKVAEKRIMFGSDFMVNLIKVRSYADYFRIFSGSAISPELKNAFCSENPRRFLFGD